MPLPWASIDHAVGQKNENQIFENKSQNVSDAK